MCEFRRKGLLFRYFVQRISSALSSDYKTTGGNKEYVEVPMAYSNTYLMKCLYFACLESSSEPNGNNDGMGLFQVFNNMKAYPRGPLEYDIYENLANIDGLVYEDGRISKVKVCTPDFEEKENAEQIREAVEKLKNRGILYMDTTKLVELSHKLDLWNDAYTFSSDRKIVITPNSVQKERLQYLSITTVA